MTVSPLTLYRIGTPSPSNPDSGLASHGPGARCCVRLPSVIRNTVDPNLDQNPRIILLVRARNAHRLRRHISPSTGNIQLGARLIKLCSHIPVRRMQSQQLLSQQVLARGQALGNVGVRPASVGDHIIDAPLARRRVEEVFMDLEPLEAIGRRGRGVVNLSHVSGDGPLMGAGDRMVRVVRPLLAADDVAPPSANAVARLDVDDLVGMRPGNAAG
jgi:hypothetical protein